jgi:hypothetical protein
MHWETSTSDVSPLSSPSREMAHRRGGGLVPNPQHHFRFKQIPLKYYYFSWIGSEHDLNTFFGDFLVNGGGYHTNFKSFWQILGDCAHAEGPKLKAN